MLFPLWTAKSGSGCTTVAAALALSLARRGPVLVVDLGGDLPAALGRPDPPHGLTDWLAATGADGSRLDGLTVETHPGVRLLARGGAHRWPADRAERFVSMVARQRGAVVVDVGVVDPVAASAMERLRQAFARERDSVLVTTSCYLAMRRVQAVHRSLGPSLRGVAFLQQPGRAIDRRQLAELVGAPVLVEIEHDPAVARAVDRGLLPTGRPRTMHRRVERLAR